MVKKVWLTVVGSKRDRGLEKWRGERLAANRDSVGILFVFLESAGWRRRWEDINIPLVVCF